MRHRITVRETVEDLALTRHRIVAPGSTPGAPGPPGAAGSSTPASTVAAGVVELATDEEAIAGVDGTRAVTPAALAAAAADGGWAGGGGSGGILTTSTNVGLATYPLPGWTFDSTISYWNFTAGSWHYLPMTPEALWEMTAIGLHVQTAGTAGAKAILAVFEASSVWQPGALVAQTAEFAIDSVGGKTPAIAASGAAGRFMLGFHPSHNCNLYLRKGSAGFGPRAGYLSSGSDGFQVVRRVPGSYSATAPVDAPDWTTSGSNGYDFAFLFPYMVAA